MKIANLKISLLFKQPFFEKKRGNQKIISKVKTWTMTQYIHSPQLVNLTGLKSWDEISQATQTIEEQFQNKCINSQVDCCMISHKGNKSVDLVKLYTELKRVWEEHIAGRIFYPDFNYELNSPSVCYLKPENRDYPTVIIWYTGTYQLMGGKSIQKILESIQIARELIDKYQKHHGV